MNNTEYLQLKEATTHGDFLSPISYYEINSEQGTFLFPLHWHNEMEITYVASGSGCYNLQFEDYEVTKGDIILIPPGVLHSARLLHENNMKIQTFVFSINMLNSLSTDACAIKYFSPLNQGDYSYGVIIHPSSEGYSDILNAFKNLLCLNNSQDYGYELALKANLFTILYQLFHYHVLIKQKNTTRYSRNADLLKKVICYIQSNYDSHISVKDLAQLCDFSEYHFLRFFKKHVGMTCIDYINNYRLDMTASLLRESDTPVMNIALDTGFNNISYFNKIFKMRFGTTPTQYRKMLNEME